MNPYVATYEGCVEAFLGRESEHAAFFSSATAHKERRTNMQNAKKEVVFRTKLKQCVGRTSGWSRSFDTNREDMRY